MRYMRVVLAALALVMTLGSYLALAQQKPQPMSFFVTSVGKGDGANYGGLAGADAHCQQLAAAAGRGARMIPEFSLKWNDSRSWNSGLPLI